MKHRSWMGAATAAAAIVLLALPASAQDWKGRGRIQGRVLTEDNKPIEGAKVTVFFGSDRAQSPEPAMTNKKGRWSVGGLRSGQWGISIEMEGFVPSEGSSHVSELRAGKTVTVNLRNLNDTEEAKKGREVRSWIDKANEAFQQGQFAAARDFYFKALPELEEDSRPRVHMAIAQTYINEEKLTEASAALDEVLKSTPDDPSALKLYANIKGKQGETEVAIETLKKLIEVDPDDAESIKLIANILVIEGREEDAQAYIDLLPEGKGIDPDAYLNLGVDEYNSNNFEAALGYFDKALAQDDTSTTAYYYRGLAYLASGNTEASKADFIKLIELDPDGQYAAQAKEFVAGL